MTDFRIPGPLGLNNHPIIDSGTLCLGSSPIPGPLSSDHHFVDELTPIARYMCAEMNANSSGAAAIKMRELNSYSSKSCFKAYQELPLWRQLLGLGITPDLCVKQQISFKAAALAIWAGKVMQGAVWDHKPMISRRFNPRSPNDVQHLHLYGRTLYYYDVWSNIHYGYVGLASGFSEDVLLDGAGLEQIGSNLARGDVPKISSNDTGLRKWDDAQDRVGIQIGIRLYKSYPSNISARALVEAVLLKSSEIQTKRFEG